MQDPDHKETICGMTSQFYDPFPKYLQIRGIILRLLRSLQVGDQLPTEEAWALEFKVS